MDGSNYVAFDIGGTWFRCATVTYNGDIDIVHKVPAISYLHHPQMTIEQLQSALVTYLSASFAELKKNDPSLQKCVISLGAALNGHTALVLQNAPLWGAGSGPFDIKRALATAQPNCEWIILNDVTAALLAHIDPNEESPGPCKTMLITISTGIAARIYDHELKRVSLHPSKGIQGEIGHLPVDFFAWDRRYQLQCDCGGASHINAFCSGRGFDNLLPLLCAAEQIRFKQSELFALGGSASDIDFTKYLYALDRRDKFAFEILDILTKPMADILRATLTIDPIVKRIVFTGGTATRIGSAYVSSLLGHLRRSPIYLLTCDGEGSDLPDIYISSLPEAGIVGCSKHQLLTGPIGS